MRHSVSHCIDLSRQIVATRCGGFTTTGVLAEYPCRRKTRNESPGTARRRRGPRMRSRLGGECTGEARLGRVIQAIWSEDAGNRHAGLSGGVCCRFWRRQRTIILSWDWRPCYGRSRDGRSCAVACQNGDRKSLSVCIVCSGNWGRRYCLVSPIYVPRRRRLGRGGGSWGRGWWLGRRGGRRRWLGRSGGSRGQGGLGRRGGRGCRSGRRGLSRAGGDAPMTAVSAARRRASRGRDRGRGRGRVARAPPRG